MDKLYNIINEHEHNGFITSSELSDCGIHRSVLRELVDSGDFYQVSRGIYARTDSWEDEFATLQLRFKKGIFSHGTALYLHEYSERVPLSFHMTFPKGYNAPALKEENVIITRVEKINYNLGITELPTPSGNIVKTYDLERSLCDILRGKGDDIQIIQYAMKKYATSKDKDINKLMRYARQLRVEPKVRKYMEVLL